MFEMHGTAAKVADVEKQLTALWSQMGSGDSEAVMRATTLNLVIYTDSPERAARITGEVPENHPCRLIVVSVDEAGGNTLSADPTIVCRPMFGREMRTHVCGEQIILSVGRDALEKAARAVQSLLLADQPTYLLWQGEFDPTHPLLTTLQVLSGGLIVDSGEFGDPEAGLRALSQIKETAELDADLFDLNWERLIPWCVSIANQFQPLSERDSLKDIKQIEIAHHDARAAGLLLFGWIADRLKWRVARDQADETWSARAPNGLVTFKLTDQPDMPAGLNSVTITTGKKTYTLSYHDADHCIVSQSEGAGQFNGARTAAPREPRRLLDTILSSNGMNPLFEKTLAATALFSEENISQHAGVVVVDTADALTRMAARKFLTFARYAIKRGGRFTVALSGGSTPKALYELLALPPFRDQVEWGKVHLFWGDERDALPTHTSSNQRMANEALISKIPIPAANVHGIAVGTQSAADAAAQYAAHIRAFFDLREGEQPEFDLVLLGMGDDGHTASLFPNTDALNAAPGVIFTANVVPQLETTRLTLTFDAINNAANVLLLVSGTKKATTLQKVLHGTFRPNETPVQRVNPDGGMLTAIADRAAAAKLR